MVKTKQSKTMLEFTQSSIQTSERFCQDHLIVSDISKMDLPLLNQSSEVLCDRTEPLRNMVGNKGHNCALSSQARRVTTPLESEERDPSSYIYEMRAISFPPQNRRKGYPEKTFLLSPGVLVDIPLRQPQRSIISLTHPKGPNCRPAPSESMSRVQQ